MLPAPPFFDFTVYRLPDTQDWAASLHGSNHLKILCVLYLDEGDDLDARLGFLKKVFLPLNIDLMNDAHLVIVKWNEAGKVRFSDLKRMAKYDKILFFGFVPKNIGVRFEVSINTPYIWDGTSVLFTDSLAALEPDVNKKRPLWMALQKMFLKN